MIIFAATLYSNLQFTSAGKRGIGQVVSPFKYDICKKTHFQIDCTNSATNLKRSRSSGVENTSTATCYKCGEQGHFSNGASIKGQRLRVTETEYYLIACQSTGRTKSSISYTRPNCSNCGADSHSNDGMLHRHFNIVKSDLSDVLACPLLPPRTKKTGGAKASRGRRTKNTSTRGRKS